MIRYEVVGSHDGNIRKTAPDSKMQGSVHLRKITRIMKRIVRDFRLHAVSVFILSEALPNWRSRLNLITLWDRMSPQLPSS